MKRATFQPIASEWLREQLATNVLKGSWHIPHRAELEELAAKLNRLEPQIRSFVVTRTLDKDYREVAAALNLVSRLSPQVIENFIIHSDPAYIEEQIKAFQDHLTKACRIMIACRSIGLLRLNVSLQKSQKWKMFAFTIAECFTTSMTKANPGRVMGYSTGGPVSRFVHLLAPLLTGEAPALESVSMQLKQDARRNKKMMIEMRKTMESATIDDSEHPF